MQYQEHDVDKVIRNTYHSDNELYKFYWNGIGGQNTRIQYVGPSTKPQVSKNTREWKRQTIPTMQQQSQTFYKALFTYGAVAGILILLTR